MFLKNFEIKRVYIIQVQPSTNISLYRIIKHSVIHLKQKKILIILEVNTEEQLSYFKVQNLVKKKMETVVLNARSKKKRKVPGTLLVIRYQCLVVYYELSAL